MFSNYKFTKLFSISVIFCNLFQNLFFFFQHHLKRWETLVKYQPNDTICHIDQTPSDYYYACLGDIDWDTNRNGLSGELEDGIDISPNIAVTRAPISTVEEAEIFVKRIISYELKPNIKTVWSNDFLMCGNVCGQCYNYNGVIKSDTHYKNDSIYNYYIAPYWNGTKVGFFDTGTDFSQGANYDFTPTNLQNELSKGYTFVSVDTHGSPKAWKTEDSIARYKVEHASALQNIGYSHLITTACYTNAFDSIPICLSEAFIRNPNSGILSYFGCSRYGWYSDSKYYFGSSQRVNLQLYYTLFNGTETCYGEIIRKTKETMLPYCTNYSRTYRWLLFGLNPIGDPEMPIYIDVPQDFEESYFSYSNGIISIGLNEDDCNVCFASLDDIDDYYECYSCSGGLAQNIIEAGSACSVCITKPNFVPYWLICGNGLKIQNEYIYGKLHILSDEVTVGSNVTLSKPQGPVTIEKGDLEIKGVNGVTFKNDFEVKKGATLNVTID